MQRVISSLSPARLTGAPVAFLVRFAGRGLAFVAAIVVARVLGVDGYGIYAYALAWSSLLAVPAMLGFDSLIVRQVAIYRARGDGAAIRGLLRFAGRTVLLVSAGLVAAAALAAAVLVDPIYLTAVLASLLIVPLRGLSAIREGALQGVRKPELSFLPLFIVYPLVLAGVVLALDAAGIGVTPQLAVAAAVVATAAGLGVALVLAHRHLRPLLRQAGGIRMEVAAWRRSLKSFTAVAIVVGASAQVGLLLLGALASADDVGVFQAAVRLSEPAGFIFLAITVTAAPRLAHAHEAGDLGELRRVAQRASRASLYYSLPVAAAILLLQEQLFGLFGSGFTGGGTALAILLAARLFNALTGSVGNVLLMTDNGAPVAWAKGAGLALNVVLCVVLIPVAGITGAAIARLADVVLWNILLAVIVWRRLGINATALPWPRDRDDAHDRI